MMQPIKNAFFFMLWLILLTGLIYPLMITGIAQLSFPWQANGSLLQQDKNWIGSALIGQSFTSPTYFWGRPSATVPYPFATMPSSGSNAGPSNPAFLAIIQARVIEFQPFNVKPIPIDLVTASASGLDPDISPAAAYYQVSRIAETRHMPENALNDLITSHLTPRCFGILGEPRVNVLRLNQALDQWRSG